MVTIQQGSEEINSNGGISLIKKMFEGNRSVSWGEQKKPRHQGVDGLQMGDLSSMILDAAVCVISFSYAAIADKHITIKS